MVGPDYCDCQGQPTWDCTNANLWETVDGTCVYTGTTTTPEPTTTTTYHNPCWGPCEYVCTWVSAAGAYEWCLYRSMCLGGCGCDTSEFPPCTYHTQGWRTSPCKPIGS